MKKNDIKLCKDCKWSKEMEDSQGFKFLELRCISPEVNSDYGAFLGSVNPRGRLCILERDQYWFAKCGVKGKQWEKK